MCIPAWVPPTSPVQPQHIRCSASLAVGPTEWAAWQCHTARCPPLEQTFNAQLSAGCNLKPLSYHTCTLCMACTCTCSRTCMHCMRMMCHGTSQAGTATFGTTMTPMRCTLACGLVRNPPQEIQDTWPTRAALATLRPPRPCVRNDQSPMPCY